MTALLTVLLFGVAFAVAIWTIVTSVTARLPRMRELIGQSVARPLPELVPTRITVRWSAPTPRPASFPLRAAA